MNDILQALPPMLTGEDLITALTALPPYDENIRSKSQAERLIALSALYEIYLPSPMSQEIYTTIYLALLRSLQKKLGNNATRQRNENHRYISQHATNGILGGSDSFTIVSCSGGGKSSAVNRAIDIITANGIIEINKPYTKIIPCLVVQCPFDSSVKGALLEILRKTDEALGSDYYTKALKGRVTTDMLIGCVSQVALNHIGLLVIDEIQNVANSKNGKNLVGALTQLINNSGISIGMVGTPESSVFFEQAFQLARRALGLRYGALEYNQFFRDFVSTLWEYQYTQHRTDIDESIMRWIYEHSGGVVSIVVSLIHSAQEIAILNGTETLDIDSLNEAYRKRLTMLHGYIEPTITRRSQTTKRQKKLDTYATTEEITATDKDIILKCVTMAKEKGVDVLKFLMEYITIEVVKI